MTRPCELVIVRHGESERNKARHGKTYFADEEARSLVAGTADYKVKLTPFGWEQARKTGVYLREKFDLPDYVYHSGYVRTMQTLDGILEAFSERQKMPIQIRMNPFIRERDPGYTADMLEGEAEKSFPWLKNYWKTNGGFFARPPGGESLSDVSGRVYTFISALFRERAGKKVWVVTHGGTLRALRFILERWSYDQAVEWAPGQSPANCGITVYRFDENLKRLTLREYNTIGWH
ncbi:MAG: hypothetical protein RJA61_421 [Candidatus Parcubacteria bacterium]|jgi:broad specificity phosphatase PhoE